MIYIDKLFFINFVIDYIILKTLSKLMKLNTKEYKYYLACLIGELSLIIIFIKSNFITETLIKIVILNLMLVTCFSYIDKKTLFKEFIYYYILSFIIGGFMYYFKTEGLLKYKYYFLLIPIFMNIYSLIEYDIKNYIKTRYKVTIYLNNGEKLFLNGFMDTGNTLIEPYSNRKVIIINKKINENFYLVPYKTIDGENLIKCFNPKKVYIENIGERNDISIGLIDKKFKGYNCLLNYKIMEELC